MANNMEREEPFSDQEFALLARNELGDIVDLEEAFPWITDAQRERVSDDDYSRLDALDEEVRYMAAEFEQGAR